MQMFKQSEIPEAIPAGAGGILGKQRSTVKPNQTIPHILFERGSDFIVWIVAMSLPSW